MSVVVRMGSGLCSTLMGLGEPNLSVVNCMDQLLVFTWRLVLGVAGYQRELGDE